MIGVRWRHCLWCGRVFPARDMRGLFCRQSCRQRAYEVRSGLVKSYMLWRPSVRAP